MGEKTTFRKKGSKGFAPGDLMVLSARRSYPALTTVDNRPSKWNNEILNLYTLKSERVYERSNYSIMLAYHLSHFYTPTGDGPYPPIKLARALLGIICTFGDAGATLKSPGLKDALDYAGITLQSYRISQDQVYVLPSHHLHYFRDLIGDRYQFFVQNPDGFIIMSSIIILTMVKLLEPKNKVRYIENRIKTFSGVVGNKQWLEEWSEDCQPDLDRLKNLNAFMSGNFLLRKIFFQNILSIARSGGDSTINRVCREIVQLIKGAEMHHLILIDTYLFNKYPELLETKLLQGCRVQMKNARDKLNSVGKDDALFMKILRPKDETTDLNRANFKNAAIMATACARFENDTFDFFYIDETETGKRIADYTTSYLDYRHTAFSVQAGAADSMCPEERGIFLKHVLSDFEEAFKNANKQEGGGLMRG